MDHLSFRMSKTAPTLDPSTGFTCTTCRLVFKTSELQRDHYKTEWHRYNLKRQVADLPPVSDVQFREKVLNFKKEKEEAVVEQEALASLSCDVCKSAFKSRNSYEDHMKSKKHAERVKKGKKGPKQTLAQADRRKPAVEEEPKASIVTEEQMEQEKLDSEGKEQDVTMESDGEGDEDSEGWHTDNGSDDEENEDDYEINEKDALPVTACLFCPRSSSSMDANLEHMQKHHGFQLPDQKFISDKEGMCKYLGLKVGAGRCCLLCPETRSRFGTVEGVQMHMREKEHCRISREAESMLEFADYYDFSPMYEEGEDGEFIDDGWMLTLPSGAKIGHRSLFHFYKQNLRVTEREGASRSQAAIDKARGVYRSLCWTGSTNVTVAKRVAKDMKLMERVKRRCELRRGVWSNKLFKIEFFC